MNTTQSIQSKNAYELLLKEQRVRYWEKFGVIPSNAEIGDFRLAGEV